MPRKNAETASATDYSGHERLEETITKAILTVLVCVMAAAAILEVKLAADQHERLARESHAAAK